MKTCRAIVLWDGDVVNIFESDPASAKRFCSRYDGSGNVTYDIIPIINDNKPVVKLRGNIVAGSGRPLPYTE